MILAVTGHRPDKLAGYSLIARQELRMFAIKALRLIQESHELDLVITGMALGWDTAIAEACVCLGIPFTAAIPFLGQEKMWNREDRVKYRNLVSRASQQKIVCEGGYSPEKMQTRNKWMVDHSDMLLALHNGSAGGTANCVQYAREKGVRVVSCWYDWERFSAAKGGEQWPPR